ncbi:MAG TPA: hypothetical protein VE359_11485, partial [Vicinamibacteria bacterium]|nr:hypothetical protein [Vicinamibacteria bacterium]
MARRLALLVSLLTALPALATPGDRPWTSDDVLGLKVVTDPQVPTDLLVLPRQPHGIREPKLLRTCQERFLDWTEKH